jgi:hypothetical protein
MTYACERVGPGEADQCVSTEMCRLGGVSAWGCVGSGEAH